MSRRIKKRGFVAVLVFLGLFLGFNALAISFTNDVKLDLTGLTSEVYINTGSQSNSLTVSGANLTVNGIPSLNPFTLENASDAILLRLTPSAGVTADFSLSSANVSAGYIIQWNTASVVLVNYVVGVLSANTNYTVKVNGASIAGSPFNSGALAQLSFSYAGAGTFTVEPPPCAQHDIWGYAWSENIGLISFSCQLIGAGVDYGVDIDEANSRLSGYAWAGGGINFDNSSARTIGWISFGDFDADGDIDLSDETIAGSPCAPNCRANINMSTGALTGWARALAPVGRPLSETGGWDGWIKLSGTGQDGNPYGPTLISGSPSEFQGWAWGGDPNNNNDEAVIGFISFNSITGGGPNKYAVYTNLSVNNVPTAINLNKTQGNYCFAASPPIFLNWTFSDPDAGDAQSAYRLQMDDDSNFLSLHTDTGKVSSSSSSLAPISPAFSATYYWRVMVWDSSDAASSWINGPSFTTDPRWPEPNFTWNPASPLVGELVTFTDATSYCAVCSYQWNFGDGSPVSSVQNPTHTFGAENIYSVNLRATSGTRWCEKSNNITVGAALPLPTWNEIAPF